MFKNILVPVDTAHAEVGGAMIDLAHKAAAGKSARITLLTVLEAIPSYIAAEIPEGVLDNRRREAEATLKALAAASAHKPAPEILVRTGSPYREIVETVEERGADLVVIASHRPGFRDYLLGSVAAKVVRHAPCSVLVYRQTAE